jgi:sarcosine oxidase
MPCLGAIFPELSLPIYTLPSDGSAESKYSSCVKLGIHARNDPVDPNRNPSSVTQEEHDEMQHAIRAAFNAEISSQPLTETKPCVYTMTPDDHFMIGVPKEYTRVCAVAGLSGHGFKMTPALGQMLADFALGKGLASWNAEFCSPSRFGV